MAHPSSSNFLDEGAFVCWRGHFYLFMGPFSDLPDVKQHLADIGIQHFFDNQLKPIKASEVLRLNPEEFFTFISQLEDKIEGLTQFSTLEDPTFEDYEKTFLEHSEFMKKEGLLKTVPYVFAKFAGALSQKQRKKALLNICHFKSPLIPFGYWNQKEGFLGVTPEILFESKDLEIKSMALAGTQRKSDSIEKLMSDPKLRNEHQIVVNELLEKWKNFGKVIKEETQVLELPSLFHLYTPIRVNLFNKVSAFELVKSLHPTSAVGVYPYEKWQKLESLTGQKERGFYGSPLLFRLGEENYLTTVSLRLVQWDQNSTRFPIGGGIVKQSRMEDEWDEIQAKLDSVKKLFGV